MQEQKNERAKRDPFDDFDDDDVGGGGNQGSPCDQINELLDLQGPPTLGHFEDDNNRLGQ